MQVVCKHRHILCSFHLLISPASLQDLAEHQGILTSGPSCLLLLCISVGNGGLIVFTSKLFHETRDDHTCPASQVMLSMVSSVTLGLLLSWRNAA